MMYIKKICSFIVLSIFLTSGAIASGINYLLPMTSNQINEQSAAEYEEVLKKSTVLKDKRATQVKSVGKKLASAINKYYSLNPKAKVPKGGFAWEFNLLKEDDTPNAWCMPGGKVAVYTGILKYTENENGLAVVMSHEIAHAVAEHGKKQSNTGVARNIGSLIVGAVGGSNAQTLYGYGSGLATLKYSRSHETQADKLGLVFMELAGYDPNKAVDFWERMSKSGSGANTPQFLSTHPSDATRIKNIKNFLKSKEFYEMTH